MSTLLFTRPKKRTRQSKSHPSPPSSWNDGFAMPAPDLKRAKTKLNSRTQMCVYVLKIVLVEHMVRTAQKIEEMDKK